MTRTLCIILAIFLASCAEDAPTTNNVAPPPPTVDTLAVRAADSAAIYNIPSGLIEQARHPNWYYNAEINLYGTWQTYYMIATNVNGNDATDMRLDGPPHTRIWMRWYDVRIPAECRYYGRYDSTGIRGHILVKHMMGDVLAPMFWRRS
jgi:hypothetical protein